MGRKKKVIAEATSEATSEAAPAGTPEIKTKADAFRAAVAQGIESPKAISEYIKTTYGMEMSAGMVSAYKSLEKNKGKKKGPKQSRSAKAPATARPSGYETGNGFTGNPNMLQLEAVKVLVKDLGAEQVKRMADLFAY